VTTASAESRRVSASEFITLASQKAREVGEAARRGLRGAQLNELVNQKINEVEDLAKRLKISDEDIDRFGTVMMKAVYKHFGDSPAVVEDLRSGVRNKLRTMAATQILNAALRPELEPYVRELTDILINAYRRGGLEEAVNSAYEYFRRAKYGGRRLVDYLFVEASESLQHEPRRMQKFSRTVLVTCPGADVCAAQCYALHGNYAQMHVKRSIAVRDAFIAALLSELFNRLNSDAALTAGLLGAAFAGGVKATGFGEIVRLHDSGDFNEEKYLAAWLVAAKLLPDKKIYTYTKTFPNVPDMSPVWQKAVELYGALFNEPPPRNFNVNISATATNYKYIKEAAEALTKLGINVPGVFFYASGNMDKYYSGREERWRELAEALVEAARRTTGKKLVLEFEHGLGPKRSVKSPPNLVRVVREVVDYAERAGIPMKISVPETAYAAGVKLGKEAKVSLGKISDHYLRSTAALPDREKVETLNEVANLLAGRGYSYVKDVEGAWTKKIEGVEFGFKRPVKVFSTPGVGEPVEVFVEPGGEKACSLCQRCVVAQHSPLKKEAFKIRITRDASAQLAEMPQTYAETPQRRAGRRKKAVAA
jgi:hypothetical protein